VNSQELAQIWTEVCAKVKTYESIDPAQIDAFFSRLHPQAASDGFIMLTADNDFIRTWIERHYASYIKMALEDINNIEYTVIIEVDATTQEPQSVAPATSQSQSRQAPMQPNAKTNVAETAAAASIPAAENKPANSETETASSTKSDEALTHKETPVPEKKKEGNPKKNGLSAFSFENFVIGDSNRMAYSMALSVAENPGKSHLNPLFIYGKSGLGKTHLLRSIQNYIEQNIPNLKVVYADSAELYNDYSDAVAAHDKDKESYRTFKARYEDADVLLIDDVQQLQGKKATLDIVFQIFNKLTSQGRQVVLSADRAPKNIDIDERYKTRFNSGGTMDIQPPEIETKLGIVKGYIEEYKETEDCIEFDIPSEVQMYIAENSSSNIRELKSAVTKIIYQMTITNQSNITLYDVRTLLENHFSGGPNRRLTVDDIQKEAEQFFKVSHADIVGRKRTRNIAHARQVTIYLCREMLDIPFEEIGKKFNRDHTTAMYSVTNVETKMKENRVMREEVETLKQLIREL
jgi:chromosomal replication initiator protein